jgi:hypothetical protein
VFRIIALLAVIGFSFVSCDREVEGSSNSNSGSRKGTLIIEHNNIVDYSEIITSVYYGNENGVSEQVYTYIRDMERQSLSLDQGTYYIEILTDRYNLGVYHNATIYADSTFTLLWNGEELYRIY